MPFSEHIWEKIVLFWKKTDDTPEKLEADRREIRELLDVAMYSRAVFQSPVNGRFDTDRAWERLDSRIKGRKLLLLLSACAAVFLLLLGSGLLLLRPYVQEGAGGPHGPAAGSPTVVELQLANGKSIVLEDGAEVGRIEDLGVILDNTSRKNCLVYHREQEEKHPREAYNTLVVPRGGEYRMVLEDSTEVWLNSSTTLRFPLQFAAGIREVYLDGEAYFKVRKDASRPFQVHTCERGIRVLGTEFNVCSYSDDRFWHTTLVEGKVEITGTEETVVLQPSQQYRLNRELGQASLETVKTSRYTAWMEGIYHFKACPLEDIIRQMERWYDFEVTYEDEDIRKLRFSGRIDKHQPFDKVLGYIGNTADVLFVVEGKHVTVRHK